MSDVPPVPGSTRLADAVAEVFADQGGLARALPVFETRQAQRDMAAAVVRAFEEAGVLLVEAGTGTGKTLAYLVPAILSGHRVLISTGTKTLQEQIFFKDLAILRQALGVPFTATYMKGRGNYLCLHRFDAFRAAVNGGGLTLGGLTPAISRGSDPQFSDPQHSSAAQIFLPIIEQWAASTETGDRAEIEDLPEDLPFWGEISAVSETCLGTECPRYQECFVTRMRQRAAESDLVVVNHHLLCADAAVRQSAYGEVIPDCHYAIVDEAHQLEDVATQYFGTSVSNYRLEELVRDGEKLIGLGAAGAEPDDLRLALDRLRDRAQRFFAALAQQLPLGTHATVIKGAGPHPRDGAPPDTARSSENRLRIKPESLEAVYEDGARLLGALDNLEATASLEDGLTHRGSDPRDVTGVRPPRDPRQRQPGDPGIDLSSLARRAAEIRDQLRFVMKASDPDYVYFLEWRPSTRRSGRPEVPEGRGRGLFLRAAPIDVSAIVREILFDRMQATVLTSATLTVEGSFDYIRGRLGLAPRQARGALSLSKGERTPGTRVLQLPSEFDYARQAVLYLPRRMPDPRSPNFVAAVGRQIIDILKQTEGRAFVLFTSYSAMRAVQPTAEESLPYPVLVQGTAPRSALLHQFRTTPHAVLLATSSFWQGVDVMGEALSCVIIDKLPFASPGDPITAARIEAIAERGGQPFNDYQVPLAILTLLQGLGRLIRHREDRGVLAILDPRLQTRGYGRRFLASLPSAVMTRNVEDIGHFLARKHPC